MWENGQWCFLLFHLLFQILVNQLLSVLNVLFVVGQYLSDAEYTDLHMDRFFHSNGTHIDFMGLSKIKARVALTVVVPPKQTLSSIRPVSV